MPALEIDEFYPPTYVDDFDRKFRTLRAERREYFAGFDRLADDIKEAVY